MLEVCVRVLLEHFLPVPPHPAHCCVFWGEVGVLLPMLPSVQLPVLPAPNPIQLAPSRTLVLAPLVLPMRALPPVPRPAPAISDPRPRRRPPRSVPSAIITAPAAPVGSAGEGGGARRARVGRAGGAGVTVGSPRPLATSRSPAAALRPVRRSPFVVAVLAVVTVVRGGRGRCDRAWRGPEDRVACGSGRGELPTAAEGVG